MLHGPLGLPELIGVLEIREDRAVLRSREARDDERAGTSPCRKSQEMQLSLYAIVAVHIRSARTIKLHPLLDNRASSISIT
jgi:hypothetical protein